MTSPELEKNILHLLQSRDKRAIQLIYQRYANTLYGIILKIVGQEEQAKDVLQEALVKIWNHSDKYDPAKGRLFTWMLNITRNAAIDVLRSGNYKRQSVKEETSSIDKERYYMFNSEIIGVRELMERLSPDQSKLLELAYYGGMTQQEISDNLNIPLGTVKSRMRLALHNLRKYIGSEYQ